MKSKGLKILLVLVVFVIAPLIMIFLDRTVPMPPIVYTLESGEYVVGKDINPGAYDVESLDDSMTVNGYILNNEDELLGVVVEEGDIVTVEGGGTVKISPKEGYPLFIDNATMTVIECSGYYDIGMQIAPGTYELSYTADESAEVPVVQLVDEGGNVVEKYDFNVSSTYTLELEVGQSLYIQKNVIDGKEVEGELVLKEVK